MVSLGSNSWKIMKASARGSAGSRRDPVPPCLPPSDSLSQNMINIKFRPQSFKNRNLPWPSVATSPSSFALLSSLPPPPPRREPNYRYVRILSRKFICLLIFVHISALAMPHPRFGFHICIRDSSTRAHLPAVASPMGCQWRHHPPHEAKLLLC